MAIKSAIRIVLGIPQGLRKANPSSSQQRTPVRMVSKAEMGAEGVCSPTQRGEVGAQQGRGTSGEAPREGGARGAAWATGEAHRGSSGLGEGLQEAPRNGGSEAERSER